MRKERRQTPKPADLSGLIGIVDEVFLDTIAARSRLALDVGQHKDMHKDPKIVRARENDRLGAAAQHALKLGIDPNFARALQYQTISESCRLQVEQADNHVVDNELTWQNASADVWRDHLKQSLLKLTAAVAGDYETMYGDNASIATKMYIEFEWKKIRHEIDDLHQGCTNLAVDLGCATGRLTRKLAERFMHTIGCDICPRMIDKAKELSQEKCAARIEYVEADIEKNRLDFLSSGSVDLVVMSVGTASDIDNLREVLASVRRVLAPHGRFVLSFYNRLALMYHMFAPWPLSLQAKVNNHRKYLEVTYKGKVYPVFGRLQEPAQIAKLLSQSGLRLSSELVTYPTIGSILPNSVLGQKEVANDEGEIMIAGPNHPKAGNMHFLEHIKEIDRMLGGSLKGAYIIATGSKAKLDLKPSDV
jgi:SAM-dependent methyltransferase/chorismate mutase